MYKDQTPPRATIVDPALSPEEDDINSRVTVPIHRSPSKKAELTADTQWQSRREKMLQDYKAFALTDLQAADAKRTKSKPHLATKPDIQRTEGTRVSPPRPTFQPPIVQRKVRELDEEIQTYPHIPKVHSSAECLLEQYPSEDLNYSQLMGNWEHTNPYVWADLLFHRKRMEMERELEEKRRRLMNQDQVETLGTKGKEMRGSDTLQRGSSLPYYPPAHRQESQGPPAQSRFYVTPPEPEYTSGHSSQRDAEEMSSFIHRTIPGHMQIQADISKVQYDIDSETQKLDRLLGDLKRSAEQSSKDYRESLKEFEMLKDDLKLTALEAEIRHRHLQSVLDEPFSYSYPSAFTINTDQLTRVLDPVPYDEPQMLSSESVFLPSHMIETPLQEAETWDNFENAHQVMIQRFNEPFNYRLRIEPGESVSIAGVVEPQGKPEAERIESFLLKEKEVGTLQKPAELTGPISHTKESPQEGETLI